MTTAEEFVKVTEPSTASTDSTVTTDCPVTEKSEFTFVGALMTSVVLTTVTGKEAVHTPSMQRKSGLGVGPGQSMKGVCSAGEGVGSDGDEDDDGITNEDDDDVTNEDDDDVTNEDDDDVTTVGDGVLGSVCEHGK